MRNPLFVFVAISALLLSACGKVETTRQMSEQEALDTLAQLPETSTRTARGRISGPSMAGLIALINQLVASGQLQLPSGTRKAADGSVDLTQLTNVLSLLGSGQANSILGLANGLISLNGGTSSGLSGGLSSIMTILQTLSPIIATVAPQYAGIIQAVMIILPLVMTFISIFKRPKTSFQYVPAFRFA